MWSVVRKVVGSDVLVVAVEVPGKSGLAAEEDGDVAGRTCLCCVMGGKETPAVVAE